VKGIQEYPEKKGRKETQERKGNPEVVYQEIGETLQDFKLIPSSNFAEIEIC
jgi:hypothetical protein